MEYGRIIKRALEVTWRYKALWIFGIAATLFGGGLKGSPGGGGQGLQYTFGGQDWERWRRTMPYMPYGPWGGVPSWESLLPIMLGILGVLFIVMLFLFLVGIVVRYTSLGALIGMVDEVEQEGETRFQSGLHIGWNRFLRLFAIDLIIGIVLAVLIALLILVLILGGLMAAAPIAFWGIKNAAGILIAVAVGLVLLLFLIAVVIALSAVLTLIREYAYRVCVLDKKGVFDALGAGITLMQNHLRDSVLLWLLLVAINIALGMVAIPLFVVGGLGLVAPAIAVYSLTQSVGAAILAAIPLLLVMVGIAILISGLYLIFRSAVWTLAFRELRSSEAAAEEA